MNDWTILLIGGASGSGKSTIANAIAQSRSVSVLMIDDITNALKTMTTADALPALHHFDGGLDWLDIGISGNVSWLQSVSREIVPALMAIIEDHLSCDVPVIIEGDFLCPQFAAEALKKDSRVRALFLHEPDIDQYIANYREREGGDDQAYRAEISAQYSLWLAEQCEALNLPLLTARPWGSAIDRLINLTNGGST